MAALSVTVKMSGGGDYTSLSAAEAGERADHHDLVGDGNTLTISCEEAGVDANLVTFGTWHTDSTHFITVTVPVTYRHTGVRATGYRFSQDMSYTSGIVCGVNYTVINGLSFNNTGATLTDYARAIYSTGEEQVIKNCLFTGFHWGLRLGGQHTKCINCIGYGNSITYWIYNSGTHYLYNCVSLNSNYGNDIEAGTTCIAKNCYFGASVVADYATATTITTCHSSDGTGTTTITSIANCHFTNSTAGSEDVNIDATSALASVGTDLHDDATYPFNTDYYEHTRFEGDWGIGADRQFTTITSTVKMSGGGSYTSLSACESGERALYHDLVTEDIALVWSCEEAGVETLGTDIVIANTWHTDATHTITIQATGIYRHTGKRGTGYRISGASNWVNCLVISIDYVIVDGLSLATSPYRSCIHIGTDGCTTIRNCLFSDSASDAIRNQNPSHDVHIVNCIFLNCPNVFTVNSNSGFVDRLYNCTALNSGEYGFYVSGVNELILVNCYSGGSATADYYEGTGTLTLITCASSDGTEGSTEISVANCHFTNSTAGSEDINIDATSALASVGTDLHDDATYPFNTDYYEHTRFEGDWGIGADRQFTTITSTVKMSGGGSYTSLSACESGERALYHDLITEDIALIFSCEESGVDANAVTFGTWHTDSTHFITITVPLTNRHTGTGATGYRVVAFASWAWCLNGNGLNINVDGISFRNIAEGGGRVVSTGYAGECRFENCLFIDGTSSGGINTAVLTYIINCIFLGCNSAYLHDSSNTVYCYNCTVLNSTDIGIHQTQSWQVGHIKNCYVGGSAGDDFDVNLTGDSTITTCASSDSTESTDIISVANCHFTNSTAGSEDIHIDNTSALLEIGTDLHADATYPFNTDFEEDVIPDGKWQIGADWILKSTPVTTTFRPIIIIV